MNIILCGLPMCGKTTMGKLLAKLLDWQFIDTDRLIEKSFEENTGRSWTCRQICAESGELIFREIERQQIASLKGAEHCVIAIGGGALCDQYSVKILQSMGNLVYLRTPEEILWKRIVARGIPAYLDAQDPERAFYALARRRTPLIEEAATRVIDTAGLSEEDVLEAIRKSVVS